MMQKSLHVRISPCVLNIFYKKLFGNDILPSCHTPLHPLYAFLTTGVNKQKKRANRLVCGALLCMVGICITDYLLECITKLTLIVSTASSMLWNTACTAAASVVSSIPNCSIMVTCMLPKKFTKPVECMYMCICVLS